MKRFLMLLSLSLACSPVFAATKTYNTPDYSIVLDSDLKDVTGGAPKHVKLEGGASDDMYVYSSNTANHAVTITINVITMPHENQNMERAQKHYIAGMLLGLSAGFGKKNIFGNQYEIYKQANSIKLNNRDFVKYTSTKIPNWDINSYTTIYNKKLYSFLIFSSAQDSASRKTISQTIENQIAQVKFNLK